MALVMKLQGNPKDGEVTIRSLVPTMHFEIHITNEMRDTLEDFRFLKTPILLMGGGKSPSFLTTALDGLEVTLPSSTRKRFPMLGHADPENDGGPDLIGKELQQFFLAG
jgi:hypothetical protein